MTLDHLPDLDAFAAPYDHDFVFKAHNPDKKTLITRYRGTVCRPSQRGYLVAAWQKSIYHFGGLTREVPLFVTVALDVNGNVTDLTLDERCYGSQGKRCDFGCLQGCMQKQLTGKPFSSLTAVYPNATAIRCLHLFEILGGAASFWNHLQEQERTSGYEQELVTIRPTPDGLTAVDEHEVLGETTRMLFVLHHNTPPVLNEENLTAGLNADAEVFYNSQFAFRETLQGDSFETAYAQLNRLFSKCYHLEKKRFGFRGRIRFTNCPSLVGLFLLTFSHGQLHGGLSRALKIEKILHFIQTGEGRTPCIGFGG